MPFIDVIEPDSASGRLSKTYQRVSGPGGQVDNVLQIHSLRPHTLEGHMALYKATLHHPHNELPVWFLEAIGVLVSMLNDCAYCARHHQAGLKRQMAAEPEKFEACVLELQKENPGPPFTSAQSAALIYARKLTRSPGDINADDIQRMRAAGLNDGKILEVNQVAAYFSYANRTVTGLGVSTAGEVLGLSPSENETWEHL